MSDEAMNDLIAEQADLQEKIDAADAWELDRGRGIPFEGNYSSWLEQKEKRLEQEGKQEESRQKELATELEWVRSSPQARMAKSKARLKAYDELLAQANDKAG